MKNILSLALVLLLMVGALAACTETPASEVTPPHTEEETPAPAETEASKPKSTASDVVAFIPIHTPFEPLVGNVTMLSRSFQNTLIFTEDAIWKISDSWIFSEEHDGDVWQLTESARMMDSVVAAAGKIERVIENTHILTTDQTLYFLDFELGETVRQAENVTSTYHWHVGTLYNPLRYVRTADGIAWRVDEAERERLPDDVELIDGMPREETIPDALLEQWFDEVRDATFELVLTEDNVLWRFLWWEDDARPEIVMENVRAIEGWIITTDNELWGIPWDGGEPYFIIGNVKTVDSGLILTLDNELWGFPFWTENEPPVKIMESVKSIQDSFGFITMDDTLWWLRGQTVTQAFEAPIPVMENVLRTWWNWHGSEYIITLNGSLWLFDYEENFLVQIFQAASSAS